MRGPSTGSAWAILPMAFDDCLGTDEDPDPATHALCSSRIYYQLDGAHVEDPPCTGSDVSGSLIDDGASLKRARAIHDALGEAHRSER